MGCFFFGLQSHRYEKQDEILTLFIYLKNFDQKLRDTTLSLASRQAEIWNPIFFDRNAVKILL